VLWAGRAAWQVLDTDYGDGDLWRAILDFWQADSRRPRLLHFVALRLDTSNKAVEFKCEDRVFDDGSLARLTLVSGERDAALRELRMNADLILLHVSLGLPTSPGAAAFEVDLSQWTAKLLARRSHRGTRVLASRLSEASSAAMAAQGFEWQLVADNALTGQYNPRWQPKGTIKSALERLSSPQHCIVIGAGLAGASTAYALGRRGWTVHVLDKAPHAAMGSSSLPAGLMAAHHSADDSPRSRLTRAGVHFTASHANRLLVRGRDWDTHGVLTLKPGTSPKFDRLGAWIKPQALVGAWLAHPGITFRGNLDVASLERQGSKDGGEWRVFDRTGTLAGVAALVVVCAAAGCKDILSQARVCDKDGKNQNWPLPSLLYAPGQVSWGHMTPADDTWAPAFSVNGLGHLAAQIPHDGQMVWLAGATFEDPASPLMEDVAHAHNLSRLAALLPGVAAALKARFETSEILAWRGVRCTTPKRLPLVGPACDAAPGLWLNTGYGARGLTWSVLCAELLAAQVLGEPWPVAFSLAEKLRQSALPQA
jgi:tRNA 5-methylaminomethyl-2-thiouridine biosynthesis bifunctional protein